MIGVRRTKGVERAFVAQVTIVALLVAAGSTTTLAALRALTIEEAVRCAEQQHPRLAGAAARVEGVAARRREVRGEGLPKVELQGARVGGLSGAKGAGLGVQGIVSSQLVADNAVGFNVTQRIYDSGELRYRRRALTHLEHASLEEAEASRRQVGLEAVDAFLQVEKQQALSSVYADLLKDRQLFARQVSAFRRAELRSGVDVALAEIQVSRARALLATARAKEAQARARLVRAMGSPSDAALPLEPTQLAPREPAAMEVLEREAIDSRPEVVAARRSVESADAEVRAIRATRNPQVVGFVSGGAADTTPHPDGELEWAGGIAVKVPIDVSSVYGSRIEQAQARLKEAAARLRDVEDQTVLEVREAFSRYLDLREQEKVDREELTQAEVALKVADSQYRANLGTFVDRLQAENAVIEARARLRERGFDLLAAWTRLQVMRGATVLAALTEAVAASSK